MWSRAEYRRVVVCRAGVRLHLNPDAYKNDSTQINEVRILVNTDALVVDSSVAKQLLSMQNLDPAAFQPVRVGATASDAGKTPTGLLKSFNLMIDGIESIMCYQSHLAKEVRHTLIKPFREVLTELDNFITKYLHNQSTQGAASNYAAIHRALLQDLLQWSKELHQQQQNLAPAHMRSTFPEVKHSSSGKEAYDLQHTKAPVFEAEEMRLVISKQGLMAQQAQRYNATMESRPRHSNSRGDRYSNNEARSGHDRDSSWGSSNKQSSSRGSSGTTQPQHHRGGSSPSAARPSGAPQGVCDQYYEHAECKVSGCKYKHVHKSTATKAST